MVFTLREPPTLDVWRMVMEEAGYVIFPSKDDTFLLNITGWRNLDGEVDKFDDWITLSWGVDNQWFMHRYPATTVPGRYWLENLMNPKGAAILAPGQYFDAYEQGLHKGKPALVQVAPVKVFRDSNRDDRIDCSDKTLESGLFGLNIHRAGWSSKVVGKWSAGCQVFQHEESFEQFLRICRYSTSKRFTYSLVEFEYGM